MVRARRRRRRHARSWPVPPGPSPRCRPWSAAPSGGDPYFPAAGNGGYDVEHYDLDARLHADHPGPEGQGDHRGHAPRPRCRASASTCATSPSPSVTVNGRPAHVHPGRRRAASITPQHARCSRACRSWSRWPTAARPASPRTTPARSTAGCPSPTARSWPTSPRARAPGTRSTTSPTTRPRTAIAVTVPDGTTAVANGDLRRQALPQRQDHVRLGGARPDGQLPVDGRHRRLHADHRRRTPGGLQDHQRRRRRPLRRADRPSAAAVLALQPEMIDFFAAAFGRYPFSSFGAVIDDDEDRRLRPREPDPADLLRRPRRRAPSPTSWPTSGTATRSRRSSGRTSGSTRASPPTPSGCGTSTRAATPSRTSSTS